MAHSNDGFGVNAPGTPIPDQAPGPAPAGASASVREQGKRDLAADKAYKEAADLKQKIATLQENNKQLAAFAKEQRGKAKKTTDPEFTRALDAEKAIRQNNKIIAGYQKNLGPVEAKVKASGVVTPEQALARGTAGTIVTPEEALRTGKPGSAAGASGGSTSTGGAAGSGGGTGGGGTSGSGGGTSAGSTPATTDQNVLDYIQANYPQYSWLAANPEIAGMFQRAIGESWDDSKIILELRKTEWWRTTAESVRGWEALKATDPGTAKRRLDEMRSLMADAVSRLGADIDPAAFETIVENALRFGWSPEEQKDALVNFASYKSGLSAGAKQQVKGLMGDYAVPLSQQQQDIFSRQLLTGEQTNESLTAYFTEQASSMYPNIANALSRGTTVRQYADPYIQIAAGDLEVPTESIDLTDPKWSRPLLQVDKDGNRTQMSLYDWRNLYRTDDAYGWKSTKQSADRADALTSFLTKTFGATS